MEYRKTKVICGENCPNYAQIDKKAIKNSDYEKIDALSNIFKIFSDTTRLRIICAILNTELRVNDICENLEINRTTVSHQLKILRDTKLVKYKKVGTEIYYSLKDAHIEQIILQALDHLGE